MLFVWAKMNSGTLGQKIESCSKAALAHGKPAKFGAVKVPVSTALECPLPKGTICCAQRLAM